MPSRPIIAAADAVARVLGAIRRLAAPASGAAARLWRLSGLLARAEGPIPVSTQFDGPVHAARGVRLSLGEHCRLGRGVFLETCGTGRIAMGAHVRVNAGTHIVSYAGVTIGDDCLIGEYTSIRDADHGMEPGTPMRLQPHSSSPVRIGRDVWIARGVVILKGVTIGDGAVIAANSVVTRDVPPMTIVAGAPARAIRERTAADRHAAPTP